LELLGGLHQPVEHGIGIDLEDPRRAPNAETFGETGDECSPWKIAPCVSSKLER
jgi:hypothetical protein